MQGNGDQYGASCTRKKLDMQEDQIQEMLCSSVRTPLCCALSIRLLSRVLLALWLTRQSETAACTLCCCDQIASLAQLVNLQAAWVCLCCSEGYFSLCNNLLNALVSLCPAVTSLPVSES